MDWFGRAGGYRRCCCGKNSRNTHKTAALGREKMLSSRWGAPAPQTPLCCQEEVVNGRARERRSRRSAFQRASRSDPTKKRCCCSGACSAGHFFSADSTRDTAHTHAPLASHSHAHSVVSPQSPPPLFSSRRHRPLTPGRSASPLSLYPSQNPYRAPRGSPAAHRPSRGRTPAGRARTRPSPRARGPQSRP